MSISANTKLDSSPHQRLRQLIEELGYTQDEAAKRIGKNFTTLNKYVSTTPTRPIPLSILMLFQAKLGIATNYIQNGVGPRFVKPELVPYASVPLVKPEQRTAFLKGSMPPPDTYRLYDKNEWEVEGLIVVEMALRDAMGEQLKPGTLVLARKLDPSQWDTVTGLVVVLHEPNRFDVKRIQQNTLPLSDTLTLHSDSPKGGAFTLPRSALVNLYQLESILASPIE